MAERDISQLPGLETPRADSLHATAFADHFRDDPVGAVRTVVAGVLSNDIDAEEAARLLLPYLVKSSYGQRNLVFNALMDCATPQDLLFAALEVYECGHDSRVLQIAADLLPHYGTKATPVLSRLARSGRPECRYFVKAIVEMEGPEQRREALLALAEHPEADTRRELLDEIDRASPEEAALVCRRLSQNSEEPIRDSAREKLADLDG